MINIPPNCPQAEIDMVRKMHQDCLALLAETGGDFISLRLNWGTGSSSGDTEGIVVVSPPFDTFSDDAQATGKFFAHRHEIVDEECSSQRGIHSTKPLCSSCWNILLYFSPEAESGKKNEQQEQGTAVTHHEDLTSLETSANVGCAICEPLHTRISRHFSFLEDYEDIRIECSWINLADDAPSRPTLFFSATQISEQRMDHNYLNLYWLQTYATDVYGHYFDLPIQSSDRGSATDSPLCRELAQYWFNRCCQNIDTTHQMCQTQSGWLPARLLDLKSAKKDGRLRIVTRDRVPPSSQYITLSHVWGPDGREKLPLLESSNMVERTQSGIMTSELPQAIKEAVDVADWFGVGWLWVDCLCILQDSATDWHREADSMSLTYRNAALNISADASPDVFGSLFVERDPTAMKPWRLAICDQSWNLTTLPQWEYTNTQSAVSFWRAWIHRERQISPRILHFTSREIVWECCCPRYASETYPGGVPFPVRNSAYGDDRKYQITMRKAAENIHKDTTFLYDAWELICNSFSCRQLTSLSDMPIIMSNLASDFSKFIPKDQYMAGLWRSTLPHSLLWTTEKIRNDSTCVNDRMPSWSWLYRCNEIETRDKVPYQPLLRIDDIDIREDLSFWDPQRITSLKVTGFWRKLRCESMLTLPNVPRNRRDSVENVWIDDDDDKRSLGPSFDQEAGDRCHIAYDQDLQDPSRTCHCLFVTVTNRQGGPFIQALVLQQIEEPGPPKFKRIGTVEFSDEMLSLKMRYRLREKCCDEEPRWQELLREHRSKRPDRPARDAAAYIDPVDLYRDDVNGDFSWLERLEPKSGILI